MFRQMTLEEFSSHMVLDMQKHFPIVLRKQDYIYVECDPTNMSIPVHSMYKEYCTNQDYQLTLDTYVQIVNKILNQHRFQINYKNVFPILKHRSFGTNDKNFVFYRKPLFADIDQLYVSDEGEVFRFVLESDDFDVEELEKAAMQNLNKMTNILSKLDDSLDIYALRYSTDYGATLLLSDTIQRQIVKSVGHNYLFCIPSSTSLIVAKYYKPYIEIIKSLIMVDDDPNKISNAIYRCNHGVYSIEDANEETVSPHLTIIK